MMTNILKWPVIFIMTIISYVLEAILKIGCYIAVPALILSVIGIFVSLLNEMIGAAAIGADKELHPTAAGLLMFGGEYRIIREFPEYFLDYAL